MTFEQLIYFIEVYRQKSITKAADNLFVSRQAVSMVIRKLEEEYAVQLFDRLQNGLEPTNIGNDFFHSAQIILNEKAVLNQKMHSYSQKSIQKLKIAMPETMIESYGDELLHLLDTLFTKVDFSFSTILAKDICKAHYDFDMVIAYMTDKTEKELLQVLKDDYVCRNLMEIPMYIWCANNSKLSQFERITFDILKQYDYYTYKNTYDYTFMEECIYEDIEKRPIISVKQNFIDIIRSRQAYTTDCYAKDEKFVFGELFADQPFQTRKIDETFYLEIIYKTEMEDYSTVISNFLTV